MTMYSDTLHWSGITPIFGLITNLDLITEFDLLHYCPPPPLGPGGLSRECVLRILMRAVKGDKMGQRNIAQVADTALSTNLT